MLNNDTCTYFVKTLINCYYHSFHVKYFSSNASPSFLIFFVNQVDRTRCRSKCSHNHLHSSLILFIVGVMYKWLPVLPLVTKEMA
jgi:hypothetical protein